jgi:hypothetical protein
MKVAPSTIFALCPEAFLTPRFVFLCSSIDKPGCWMVVVRLMMVLWSECHQPHVCFLITRDLYERGKIGGSEIRFTDPQNQGVQFLHIFTGWSQITCLRLLYKKEYVAARMPFGMLKTSNTLNVYTVRYFATA